MMVGIYARENSDKKRLREYCQVMNWKVDIYIDFDKLLYDARRRKIDMVLVKNVNGIFTEPPIKILKCLEEITGCGCRFMSLDDGIDSDKRMWEVPLVIAINNMQKPEDEVKKRGRPKITDPKKMSKRTLMRRIKENLL